MMDYFVANSALTPAPTGIQSTAGAVPVKNDKGEFISEVISISCLLISTLEFAGEVSMKKVKVHRYVSGKRPEYAPTASTDEESEDDDFMDRRGRDYDESEQLPPDVPDAVDEDIEEREKDDPRLRRLTRLEREREQNDDDIEEVRAERRRRIEEPEVLIADIEETPRERIKLDSSESSDEEELSEDEIERRRESVRRRALQRKEAEEELIKEEDEEENRSAAGDSSAESSSEYEEYTDSEEETGPRLKPVFVRKSDRVTVLEKAKEAEKKKLLALETEKLAEQRKKASKKVKKTTFIHKCNLCISHDFDNLAGGRMRKARTTSQM